MDATPLPTLAPPDPSWKGVSEQAPPSGRVVLYRTAFYQMLGYINQLGHWIGGDGQEESFPVQWWREVH
jgi:hypothetical protein